MLGFTIAALTGLVIIAVFWVAHLIDRSDAKSLYRAHRKERRRITIIREGNSEIVGEWVKL